MTNLLSRTFWNYSRTNLSLFSRSLTVRCHGVVIAPTVTRLSSVHRRLHSTATDTDSPNQGQRHDRSPSSTRPPWRKFESQLVSVGTGMYKWKQLPKNVLLAKKPTDTQAAKWLGMLADYLSITHNMNIFVDEPTYLEHPRVSKIRSDKMDQIDFVIAFGGDGTLLHINSLFKNLYVPPVLAFSMGTLGFLMPFRADNWKNVLEQVMKDPFYVRPRLRLQGSLVAAQGKDCTVRYDDVVINDISVTRDGQNPLLFDVHVNGRLVTSGLGDGMIVSSPTGSTAYSLSAGGSLVHPSVTCMLLTPICPFSLSFRPLVLPADTCVEIGVPMASRSNALVNLDGRRREKLMPGQKIAIRAALHPIPTIEKESSVNPWISSIGTHLKWNYNPNHYNARN